MDVLKDIDRLDLATNDEIIHIVQLFNRKALKKDLSIDFNLKYNSPFCKKITTCLPQIDDLFLDEHPPEPTTMFVWDPKIEHKQELEEAYTFNPHEQALEQAVIPSSNNNNHRNISQIPHFSHQYKTQNIYTQLNPSNNNNNNNLNMYNSFRRIPSHHIPSNTNKNILAPSTQLLVKDLCQPTNPGYLVRNNNYNNSIYTSQGTDVINQRFD